MSMDLFSSIIGSIVWFVVGVVGYVIATYLMKKFRGPR